MIGFWFGIGVILAAGVADGLIIVLGCLQATNEITNKMAEQTQVNAHNVEVPLRCVKAWVFS